MFLSGSRRVEYVCFYNVFLALPSTRVAGAEISRNAQGFSHITGIHTFGCGIQTFRCGIQTFGCGIQTFGCGIQTFGCRIVTFGCRFQTLRSELEPEFRP